MAELDDVLCMTANAKSDLGHFNVAYIRKNKVNFGINICTGQCLYSCLCI